MFQNNISPAGAGARSGEKVGGEVPPKRLPWTAAEDERCVYWRRAKNGVVRVAAIDRRAEAQRYVWGEFASSSVRHIICKTVAKRGVCCEVYANII